MNQPSHEEVRACFEELLRGKQQPGPSETPEFTARSWFYSGIQFMRRAWPGESIPANQTEQKVIGSETCAADWSQELLAHYYTLAEACEVSAAQIPIGDDIDLRDGWRREAEVFREAARILLRLKQRHEAQGAPLNEATCSPSEEASRQIQESSAPTVQGESLDAIQQGFNESFGYTDSLTPEAWADRHRSSAFIGFKAGVKWKESRASQTVKADLVREQLYKSCKKLLMWLDDMGEDELANTSYLHTQGCVDEARAAIAAHEEAHRNTAKGEEKDV